MHALLKNQIQQVLNFIVIGPEISGSDVRNRKIYLVWHYFYQHWLFNVIVCMVRHESLPRSLGCWIIEKLCTIFPFYQNYSNRKQRMENGSIVEWFLLPNFHYFGPQFWQKHKNLLTCWLYNIFMAISLFVFIMSAFCAFGTVNKK